MQFGQFVQPHLVDFFGCHPRGGARTQSPSVKFVAARPRPHACIHRGFRSLRLQLGDLFFERGSNPVAGNLFSVAADLPQACQALYANVAGPAVTLRPADFTDFPEAINHSINTKGCLCFEELANKPKEFGYLRITMDPNMGDSPGSPFVLEIWPAGHGSPIHDHGDACAVIKVLDGTIRVKWFPGLSPDIETPYGQVDLTEGDVTFLTPRAYQIHQLFNPATDNRMTATIQCYRYADEDTVHYEYFDYVEGGVIKQFTPDSDWEYLKFKALIHAEWTAHKTALAAV